MRLVFTHARLPYGLVLATAILAFLVVGLGAYVRLSDAGLGCPDWPGCYGHLSPRHAAAAIAAAQVQAPDGPVSPAKAWKEMIHRYLASSLGMAVLVIAWLAWRRERGINRTLGVGLAGLVVFQGLLGMWTVTLLLRPIIVTAHLLGGMATLALLVWLLARLSGTSGMFGTSSPGLPLATAGLALAAVALQIALGGWVSTNYAALACTDFPTCGGRWWPPADWAGAFSFNRGLGLDVLGHALSSQALIAMHWAHRLGALLVAVAVGRLGLRLLGHPQWRRWGWLLLVLLVVQVALGVANVLASLPLPVAVAHNQGAALLLATLVWLNVAMRRAA
jgi:cytochrome c oxidase assembly protein subunit 15